MGGGAQAGLYTRAGAMCAHDACMAPRASLFLHAPSLAFDGGRAILGVHTCCARRRLRSRRNKTAAATNAGLDRRGLVPIRSQSAQTHPAPTPRVGKGKENKRRGLVEGQSRVFGGRGGAVASAEEESGPGGGGGESSGMAPSILRAPILSDGPGIGKMDPSHLFFTPIDVPPAAAKSSLHQSLSFFVPGSEIDRSILLRPSPLSRAQFP